MPTLTNIPAILVVEDDEIVLDTLRRALQSAGYTVFMASGSQQALNLVKSGAAPISVAILDYGLPGMPGTELGEELAKLIPNLRVLISSGMPAGSMQLRPGQRYLDKPYNVRTLLRAVLDEVLSASVESAGSAGN